MPLIMKVTPFVCSSPPAKMTLKSLLLGKWYLRSPVSFQNVSDTLNTSICIRIISLATLKERVKAREQYNPGWILNYVNAVEFRKYQRFGMKIEE